MKTQKPLLKDKDGKEVDVYLYRSMIGSLMYLTSLRHDIMFAVCACARYQVNPKVSHLHVVKRIFKYLKGQPKLGLWYPKDSPFNLVAYTDSDYARASLDRKSTTRGCQFLGSRLISWQCKKQTVVANSITEAKYIAASSCCGQVLWIKNQLLDYGYNFMHTKIYIDNESTICIAIDESVEARLKRIELPKGVLDFKKIKLEKAAKQNMPKKSLNKSATAIYDQKSRLYRMIKKVKAFNHSTHKALYDALVVSLSVDEGDMDMIFGKSHQTKRRRDDHDKDPSPNADKNSNKRQKKPNSSKNDKDQTGTSKQGKPSSKPSKSNKHVDADEVIQDIETDTGECVEDAAHDSILTTHVINKTEWFKQSPRPATPKTPDPDGSKDQNADIGPEQNWFPKLEKPTKAPEDFDDVLRSTFDFLNFMKYRLKKDTLTKADFEGPVFELFKGSYKSCIKLEYHLEQRYLAFFDKLD
ncbi:hypothetical protein Tco_0183564 [Tanacetum coccineum]